MNHERIRPATQEEIEAIASNSDLTPLSKVWAYYDCRAVTRMAPEIDPIYFGNKTPDIRKAWFVWGLENMLKGSGVTEYYFNCKVSDEKWLNTVKGFGATQMSMEPEYRFKKVI